MIPSLIDMFSRQVVFNSANSSSVYSLSEIPAAMAAVTHNFQL
jgi:hypothetical protein